MLSFVNSVINAFDIGEDKTRVGVVTFSNDAQLQFPMNEFLDSRALQESVLAIRHIGGQTNTGKGLYVTRQECFSEFYGDRPGVVNIAVVITDGLPTIMEYDTLFESDLLKEKSTVLAVGITANVESQFLRDISSFPQRENENYFTTPDFSDLTGILNVLVSETCQAPLRTTVTPSQGNQLFSFFLSDCCSNSAVDFRCGVPGNSFFSEV